MYQLEIYLKGVEDPVFATGTEEDYILICERLGDKFIVTLDNDGEELTVLLKDAYVVYKTPIEDDELQKFIDAKWSFEEEDKHD